jgi:2-amino-4-hydroxy-6-hydroxymethyldihydropteridine diphosphokinase
MACVYLSLGSNIDRYRHLTTALDALAEEFINVTVSTVYESEAVGFDGDNFLNFVACIETSNSVSELSLFLKKIEDQSGRNRKTPRFSARTLDIDILTYDKHVGVIDGVTLPRAEITENAFVLKPLADLAPAQLHPVLGVSYHELWQQYSAVQKLWPVDFTWPVS